ncbi:MAG: hypothetical protein EZS28_005098 [Streblomastix strix]|uniref:Uncharacterized protein n=1 Tax=Streblomastix strix TaxID=222440 RepID=A0A5J4WWF3_9EUKA|nr:MAG: hypothetical protein EZS28_005098 [Streblomastix strix]
MQQGKLNICFRTRHRLSVGHPYCSESLVLYSSSSIHTTYLPSTNFDVIAALLKAEGLHEGIVAASVAATKRAMV